MVRGVEGVLVEDDRLPQHPHRGGGDQKMVDGPRLDVIRWTRCATIVSGGVALGVAVVRADGRRLVGDLLGDGQSLGLQQSEGVRGDLAVEVAAAQDRCAAMLALESEETLRQLPSSTSKIVYGPMPKDDPKRRKPDIALARELLGWEPRIPLRDGLAKTIAYFRSLLAK